MAQKQGKRDEYVLDGMLYVPENVDEFVYDDNIFDDDTGEVAIGDNPFAITTPEILRIVSQDVRTASNGTQVVDVIVEVTDIPGITKYEFRVTKVD